MDKKKQQSIAGASAGVQKQLDRDFQKPREALIQSITSSVSVRQSFIKISTEMAEFSKKQPEFKPLPEKILKAVEEHQKTIEKARTKAEMQSKVFSIKKDRPMWWAGTGAGAASSGCEEIQTSVLGCDLARFDILIKIGTAAGGPVQNPGECTPDNLSCKTAGGIAGTASMYPANGAVSFSHIRFGFWSGYRVPFPNETVNVKIQSNPHISLGSELEALTFNAAHVGWVLINTNLYVYTSEFQHEEVRQVCVGFSPPPPTPFGSFGVWHPEPSTVDESIAIEFDINNSSTMAAIYIFESVDCIAIRSGDVQMCSALAGCWATFPPIQVLATKIC